MITIKGSALRWTFWIIRMKNSCFHEKITEKVKKVKNSWLSWPPKFAPIKIGQESQDFMTFFKKVVKQLSAGPIPYIRSNIIEKYIFWQKKIFKKIPAWGGWMLYAQEGSKILGQKMFQNGVLILGNIYPNPSEVFSDPTNDKL